jgi:hypothetical protein
MLMVFTTLQVAQAQQVGETQTPCPARQKALTLAKSPRAKAADRVAALMGSNAQTQHNGSNAAASSR